MMVGSVLVQTVVIVLRVLLLNISPVYYILMYETEHFVAKKLRFLD